MKRNYLKMINALFVAMTLLFVSVSVSAQSTDTYEKAKQEIIQTVGSFPVMFKAFPKHALAGAWETFKSLRATDSKIPPKYRELIQLAVAAQIPCVYCIYFHTASAFALGATQEEVEEAIALGAETRHWSTILQGNQVDFEQFKAEVDGMLKFMAENANK